MLRVDQFRAQFLAFFRVLSSTDAYIDIAYKGRAYRVHVDDLNMDVPRKSKHKKKRTLATQIKSSKCPLCGGLSINGVCASPGKH